ncbi:WD40 repeat-containing protein [Tieghemostelium lacteum]|uniref:WD40 repeat-containing protein n=1 Tax=Tieghemostelium lacteum TaxID=361077 RepID=A0A151ZEA8_TIELA|nr:WD40 repeat-containing protein [Tieghemostelium lacteum]|eukprot:KYQ92267.1 WD40 repeat-containing protein [Tieghemostelium lacteum]
MFNTNISSNTNVYGLSLKARSLSHVVAEPDHNRFLVGTNALKEENEVCLLEYREQEGVKCLSILPHPHEIWSITSSSFDANQFFTVYNTGSEFKSSLWEINTDNQNSLKELFELKDTQQPHQGMIKPILCDPSGSKDYVVSLDDSNIRVWSGIDNSSPTVLKNFGQNLTKLSVGCINSNISNQLATANDNNIRIWDIKSGKETHTFDKAHSGYIRDIDFNPNKKYNILSAGDDGKLKIWDTRHPKEPVKIFAGHNHWIWNAKFNKHHDQLIITSSSDNTVKLWNLYSLSSAISTSNSDESDNTTQQQNENTNNKPTGKKNKRNEDQLIKIYEEHEDSVYNISWSTSNFQFASLSYDGRLVMNDVPKEYSDILSY